MHSALTFVPVSSAARLVNLIGFGIVLWSGAILGMVVKLVPREKRGSRFWMGLSLTCIVLATGGFMVIDASYVMVHWWAWAVLCAAVVAGLAWLLWTMLRPERPAKAAPPA